MSSTSHANAQKQLLVDFHPVAVSLEEGSEGKLVVRGEFGVCDKPTANNRSYPSTLMEREIRRLGKALRERRVFGELDHPGDGRTQLSRVSHLITELQVDGTTLKGVAEPVDTAKGKDLQALLRSGARVGISLRGAGSVRKNEHGVDVVQEDYRLFTCDFVADPAANVFPEVFLEETAMSVIANLTEVELRDTNPEVVKTIEAKTETRLKEDFARALTAQLTEVRDQVRAQERAALLADPSVGLAKRTVDALRPILAPVLLPEDVQGVVKQKDAELEQLRRQLADVQVQLQESKGTVDKLAAVAKKAGYTLDLERRLAGDPDAECIRTAIGDVTLFESVEALRARTTALQEEAGSRRKALEEERQKVAAEKAKAEAEQTEQRKTLLKLTEALETAVKSHRALEVQLYIEQKLKNHPQEKAARAKLTEAKPETVAAVDSLLAEAMEETRPPRLDAEQRTAVRARVRKFMNGGVSEAPPAVRTEEKEEKPSGQLAEEFRDLGLDWDELKSLSGLGR